MKWFLLVLILLTALIAFNYSYYQPQEKLNTFKGNPVSDNRTLDFISLPPGFSINYYTASVPGARSLTKANENTVFVGSRHEGKVYALTDSDNNGYAEKISTIAANLNSPNGVSFYQGTLYVAEISKITAYTNILDNLDKPPQPTIVTDSLPSDAHHGWRYIDIGPDGKLYIAIGAPCNNCTSNKPYAAIWRINLSTKKQELVASGVRNSVGFDWDPKNGNFWFTDNGIDGLGDLLPPDELNLVSQTGKDFGYPKCFGANHTDCPDSIPSALDLTPHAAALGVRFYSGNMFPKNYQNRLFIAEHGSWNSSVKVGYRIMSVKVNDQTASDYQIFASGWLSPEGKVLGRPVDLLEMNDGSLLLSDDYSGSVYRITYQR